MIHLNADQALLHQQHYQPVEKVSDAFQHQHPEYHAFLHLQATHLAQQTCSLHQVAHYLADCLLHLHAVHCKPQLPSRHAAYTHHNLVVLSSQALSCILPMCD